MPKREKLAKEIDWLIREKYGNKPNGKLEKDIERLVKGEPVDYVIGFRPFLGCKIDLSFRPLIPRSETEFWVEEVIGQIKNHKSKVKDLKQKGLNLENKKKGEIKTLDLFAGSGCIGVALLKHLARVKVDFGEKDRNLLKQIKLNCSLNGIKKERYKAVETDIFSQLKGKYDFIFANPPYISSPRLGTVQKSVLDYEPKEALFGGRDGLLVVKKFLKEANSHLNPGGKIYLEFGQGQMKEIKKLAKALGYKNCEMKKDQFGRWRRALLEC